MKPLAKLKEKYDLAAPLPIVSGQQAHAASRGLSRDNFSTGQHLGLHSRPLVPRWGAPRASPGSEPAPGGVFINKEDTTTYTAELLTHTQTTKHEHE